MNLMNGSPEQSRDRQGSIFETCLNFESLHFSFLLRGSNRQRKLASRNWEKREFWYNRGKDRFRDAFQVFSRYKKQLFREGWNTRRDRKKIARFESVDQRFRDACLKLRKTVTISRGDNRQKTDLSLRYRVWPELQSPHALRSLFHPSTYFQYFCSFQFLINVCIFDEYKRRDGKYETRKLPKLRFLATKDLGGNVNIYYSQVKYTVYRLTKHTRTMFVKQTYISNY